MGSFTFQQPGLNGRVLGLNQGKILGGSSALNAQVFVPPLEGLLTHGRLSETSSGIGLPYRDISPKPTAVRLLPRMPKKLWQLITGLD